MEIISKIKRLFKKTITTEMRRPDPQQFFNNVKYLYDEKLINDEEYEFFLKVLKNNDVKDETVQKKGSRNSKNS